MEPVTDLREGLERGCTEAAQNLRRYNDLEVKLWQACKELDDEKMAREHAEKRLAVLELAVEAAATDLKLVKLSSQDAKERILLRESQRRAFHSAVAEIAKVQRWQQDQLSKMLQTSEIGNSDNDHDNTNVQSITSPSSIIRPSPLHQHTVEHQSSKRHRKSTSQSTTHSKSADLERDVEPFGEDVLLSEEPPILVMEANLDYEGHEDLQHHSALKWKEGSMATIMAELQASESMFFSKLIGHTHLVLRRRQQLYLPVSFTNKHGDKLAEWVVLRTRSSSRTWRVRLHFFKKPYGSARAQISGGWNDFVIDNHLKNGDSLVFVLNVETTFQVYIFRRSQR